MAQLAVMVFSVACGAAVAGAEIVLGLYFVAAPGQLADWQRDLQVKIVIFGGCVAFFSVTYTVAKWLFPWIGNEQQFREFCMATKAHLALLNVVWVGALLCGVCSGLWGVWLAAPALFIGISLAPFALLESFRSWRTERRYYDRLDAMRQR